MSNSFPARTGSWKWWICGLLLLASTINYMDRQTLSNAAVQIKGEFGLSNEQYGNLELAFGWAFAFGSLIFGLAADRISVRWLYPAVLVLWSAVGFGTGLVRSYEGLLVCRTLLGLFEAGHWPCALKTTQCLLASRDRAMGNSVLQSGTSIGAVITPLLMNWMMTDQQGSWRLAFQAIGGAGMLWIVLWLSSVRGGDLPGASRGFETISSDPTAPAISFWRIVWNRRFVVLIVIIVLINTSWQLLRAWLPMFLQQGRGYTAVEARYFNALYYVATDIGCLAAGALTLWWHRRGCSVHDSRRRVFFCCAILTALTTFVMILPKGYLLLGTLLLVGMGALGVFPCYYALSQELTTTHQGKVTGLTGVFAWALSAPVHTLFGRLVDRTGSFDLGLAVVGWMPIIAFFALLLFWEPGKRGLMRKG
jgi:MFS transporter, ACS family, hexuronate transporter